MAALTNKETLGQRRTWEGMAAQDRAGISLADEEPMGMGTEGDGGFWVAATGLC